MLCPSKDIKPAAYFTDGRQQCHHLIGEIHHEQNAVLACCTQTNSRTYAKLKLTYLQFQKVSWAHHWVCHCMRSQIDGC